jgi:DNA-binding CsgD family transcriptional regulator
MIKDNAPMDHQQAIRPSSVFVHSRHPLVCQTIERSLLPLTYEIKLFSPLTGRNSDDCNWILILDSYTVEGWLDVAMQCKLRGGRSIIILPEISQEMELRLVYLGVNGAVLIHTVYDELKHAVDAVLKGHLWFRRDTVDEYVKRTTHKSGLIFSVREEQIVIFLAEGFSNKQIGNALAISERTVKFHVSNILRKCNVKNRRSLFEVPVRKIQSARDILSRSEVA